MAASQKHIDKIRFFNRFYTSIIGVLDRHILESEYSLSEARVMFEIDRLDMCTARQIKEHMNIDEGYLSRILEKFVNKGFVKKNKSKEDSRAYNLSLAPKGKAIFKKLNTASDNEVRNLIERLTPDDREELVHNMDAIVHILSKS